MDYIRQKVDNGAPSIEQSEYESQAFAEDRAWESFSEDLYSILIDKSAWEALTRVRSVKPGQGAKPYFALHKWFTETTGMAIADRMKLAMTPVMPKLES